MCVSVHLHHLTAALLACIQLQRTLQCLFNHLSCIRSAAVETQSGKAPRPRSLGVVTAHKKLPNLCSDQFYGPVRVILKRILMRSLAIVINYATEKSVRNMKLLAAVDPPNGPIKLHATFSRHHQPLEQSVLIETNNSLL